MPATQFALLAQVCGLSHREAADCLGVRIDTVKSWSAGRNPTPPGVLDQLSELARKIDRAADEALDLIKRQAKKRGAPAVVELALARDDAEARELGWPCVGAQAACFGRVIARGRATGQVFAVVPRGSRHQTS